MRERYRTSFEGRKFSYNRENGGVYYRTKDLLGWNACAVLVYSKERCRLSGTGCYRVPGEVKIPTTDHADFNIPDTVYLYTVLYYVLYVVL